MGLWWGHQDRRALSPEPGPPRRWSLKAAQDPCWGALGSWLFPGGHLTLARATWPTLTLLPGARSGPEAVPRASYVTFPLPVRTDGSALHLPPPKQNQRTRGSPHSTGFRADSSHLEREAEGAPNGMAGTRVETLLLGHSRPVWCRGGLGDGEVTEEDVLPETQPRAQNRKCQLQRWPQG